MYFKILKNFLFYVPLKKDIHTVHNCGFITFQELFSTGSLHFSVAVQFDVTATSSWIKNEILWCAETPGVGAYVFFSSFPCTWCGFPERSGTGWETSHRSPTTPVAPWQSCSDIRDEDVLSIHPLWSLMVGGDLTCFVAIGESGSFPLWSHAVLSSCFLDHLKVWSFGVLRLSASACVLSTLYTHYIWLSGVFTVTMVFKMLCRGFSVTQITQDWLDTRWKELSALLTCSIETLPQYSA